MSKLTQRYKDIVLEHLEEKYQERGKDFFFKSKRISRDLDISKYVIGRVIMEETKKENPKVIVVRNSGHGSSLFKTWFECTI